MDNVNLNTFHTNKCCYKQVACAINCSMVSKIDIYNSMELILTESMSHVAVRKYLNKQVMKSFCKCHICSLFTEISLLPCRNTSSPKSMTDISIKWQGWNIYIFFIVNSSPKKTKTNNVLVHLLLLSDFSALSVPRNSLSHSNPMGLYWRCKSIKTPQKYLGSFLKRPNNFEKLLSAVVFSKHYSKREETVQLLSSF